LKGEFGLRKNVHNGREVESHAFIENEVRWVAVGQGMDLQEEFFE
jgi:hypothetical protein